MFLVKRMPSLYPDILPPIYPLFVELLQVVIGVREQLSVNPTDAQWTEIFAVAHAQALTGICFAGVQMLPSEQQPHDADLLGNWFAQVQNIRRANAEQQQAVKQIANILNKEGFTSCLLKGQEVAYRYPEQLRELRMAGDVDVWVWKEGYTLQDTIVSCLCLARKYDGGTIRYHHVDCGIAGQMVELHFRPTFMSNPIHNRRLQSWCIKQRSSFLWSQEWEMLSPDGDFDIVYQLAHLYRHLFDEGVGMRQVMDFYFSVSSYQGNKSILHQTLRQLGLYNFCGAMMYVLQSLLVLSKQAILVPVDDWRGKMVLGQIWRDGNFGSNHRKRNLQQSDAGHYLRKTCRNSRFLIYFPEEVIAEPLFRIYHFFWRINTARHNGRV